MGLPSISLTVTDGGLGIISDDDSANVGLVGVSSTGTTNFAVTYSGTDAIDSMRTTFGEGPLVEAGALYLTTGKGTVTMVRMPAATAGTSGSVTLTGTSPTITLSGTPNDDYDLSVVVTTGGTTAAGYVKWSLDGGATYSDPIVMTAPYLIPNSGLTLTFPAGTYVLADSWSAVIYAGMMSDANAAVGLQTIANVANLGCDFFHVVGFSAATTDALRGAALATLIAAVDTKLTSLAASGLFCTAVVDGCRAARTAAGAASITATLTAINSTCVGYGGGELETLSPIKFRWYKRSVTWAAVARARRVDYWEHLGHRARGDLGTRYRNPTHDQRVDPTYDTGRAITVRTWPRKAGVYIAEAKLIAPSTSDFQRLERSRVMNRACEIAYDGIADYVGASPRVTLATGLILEDDASAMETIVNQHLSVMLAEPNGQAVSGVSVSVNRTGNILSTGNLKFKVRLVPLACARTVTAEVAYSNPSIGA